MKKKVLAAVVLMILALCLFGCGKNNNGDGSGADAGSSVNSSVGGDFSYAIDGEGNIVDYEGNTYNGKDFSIDDSGNIYDNHSGDIVGSVVSGSINESDSYSDGGSYSQNEFSQNAASDHSHDVLSLLVYRVDDNTLHARIEDGKNSGILGTGVNQVYVRITDSENKECASISFSSDYASFGYYTDNGSEWHGSDSSSNIALYANVAGATFGGNGIANGIRDGLNYSVEIYKDGGNVDPVYGEGKVSVKDASEAELSEIVAEEALAYVPKDKAHSAWAGQYVYSNSHYDEDYNYVYEYGVADISITDSGAIRVDLEGSGEKRIYVLEEKEYEEINYEYGTVIEGSAKMPGGDYHNSADMRYTKEADSPATYSLETEFYKDNQYYEYSYSLYPIGTAAAAAPGNFSDTDRYGYVDAILNDKSNFLYPATDNYIFSVTDENSSVYNDSTKDYTYYPGVKVTLYELDKNDICLNSKTVVTFESPAAASAVYSYQQSWYSYNSTYHFELMGNETRLTNPPSYYYGRQYFLKSYSTYDGMHYADYMYSSDGHMDYIYSSKPFDSSRSNPGLELVKIMAAIPSGGHRSIDSQTASMATSISPNLYTGADISFSVYGEGCNYSVDNYYAVYDGLTAHMISYTEEWENSGYANYVCVDEITFGYEEATATRNKYKVDDFSNVTVTLDNYQSMTPDSTETHRFDMTRVI